MTNTPFSQRLRVRAYECDSLGHVNNAVYLQYLQQLTLDAHGWLDGSVSPPMPRTCAVEYQTPARYGDELDLTTWIVRVEGQHCTRGYEITRAQDGANVLRAQIEWRMERVPAWTGKERALPLKPLNVRGDNGALPWRWRHVVRRYEVDVTQGVQFAAYFHWLEEATFRTAHVSGWTMERLRAENFITLQFRHDAEFFAPAHNGEEIEIVSRLFEVRRVRGTWIHEMRRTRDNALLLRDYSTGAFLDWQGNIRPAPPGMMERLMQGEM
jgi:acyl-CoA thioester hydrolase